MLISLFWFLMLVLFKVFCTGSYHFGCGLIIKNHYILNSHFWICPNLFGQVQNILDQSKTNWTGPNSFWAYRRTRHFCQNLQLEIRQCSSSSSCFTMPGKIYSACRNINSILQDMGKCVYIFFTIFLPIFRLMQSVAQIIHKMLLGFRIAFFKVTESESLAVSFTAWHFKSEYLSALHFFAPFP